MCTRIYFAYNCGHAARNAAYYNYCESITVDRKGESIRRTGHVQISSGNKSQFPPTACKAASNPAEKRIRWLSHRVDV